jgi:hypothetical protein
MATVTHAGYDTGSDAHVGVGWAEQGAVARDHRAANLPQSRRLPGGWTSANPWNCLIVSTAASRRDRLAREASAGGWTANRCGRLDAALRIARQRLAWLVIVELTAGTDGAALDELADHVTKIGGLLLVLSAQEGGVAEEIRARQLGAWLYLPGEVPDGELTTLCTDARRLLDRPNG